MMNTICYDILCETWVRAGPGFGGSCFKKDVLNLVYLCETYGLQEVADYWHQVILMNDYQQERIVSRMLKEMFNTVANKKIAIFGFAFKANTGDTREAPAINICCMLAEEHAKLAITDPKALSNAKKDLVDLPSVIYSENPYEVVQDADAIVLMTDWSLYQTLDWKKIHASMRKPAFIFDTRNHLCAEMIRSIGFHLIVVGK